MKELIIGNTKLEYILRESRKAKYKRVEITPDRIEVIVPRGTPPKAVLNFLEEEKNNIFASFLEIENRSKKKETCEPVHYASGAKVLYRGRMEFLYVKKSDVNDITINYRSGFYICYPDNISEIDKNRVIKKSLEQWMKKKIEYDAKRCVKTYGDKLGLYPEGIRIKDQKHLWASCGKDRIININWQLMRFHKQILEYVVIHELCHLKYRNHSKDFWVLVGSVMPEYKKYHKILNKIYSKNNFL